MGHEDKGSYAHKHDHQTADPQIIKQLVSMAIDGTIPCASAHKAAASLGVSPEAVGLQIDLAELQITHCQVGLFGYPDTGKKLDHNFAVSSDLEQEIRRLAPEGRISCADAWEVARIFALSRLDMGSACETLMVKIKPCQLGTF